jgi:hypothetical protein
MGDFLPVDVVSKAKLDDVYCAALDLSTAVTEFFILAIKYFTNMWGYTCYIA